MKKKAAISVLQQNAPDPVKVVTPTPIHFKFKNIFNVVNKTKQRVSHAGVTFYRCKLSPWKITWHDLNFDLLNDFLDPRPGQVRNLLRRLQDKRVFVVALTEVDLPLWELGFNVSVVGDGGPVVGRPVVKYQLVDVVRDNLPKRKICYWEFDPDWNSKENGLSNAKS